MVIVLAPESQLLEKNYKFYLRCILSLSLAFLLSYDNQPANKHSNSVFILLRGTASYATVSLSTSQQK